jgi:hypothetical protein
MRETLDCGVLMVPAHAEWMRGWMDRHAADMARVRLHAVELDGGGVMVASQGRATAYAGAPAAAQALARAALSLRRFDACLLPVTPDTLGWTRTALSCARDGLRTPLIGVAKGLKAAAVEDLLALGMCDFMRHPLCPEELRVRVDRVAGGKRPRATGGGRVGDGADPDAAWGSENAFSYPEPVDAARAGAECVLQEPASRYARYGAEPAATAAAPLALSTSASAAMAAMQAGPLGMDTRPRVSREAIDSSLLAIQAAPRIHPDEPFRIAKSRVVDSFERDYVRTALSRHSGNVARAARASSKHRRAFWALMRKHHIDAAPYRSRQERTNNLD